jgi:DNA repair protein RecO (recombination protein O)
MPRPDRAFRTPAIILKRRDFNESDRLLTILTPEHGKLDVIAKGARKLTNARMGHVELFTRGDMLIHRGRDFGIVVQAEMLKPFQALREDLARGAYASYAAELIDRFTNIGDEDTRRTFDLLDATLERLCGEGEARLVMRYFELHLLDLVGFRPELNECVVGHEPLEPCDQYFSYSEGGVVSPAYAVGSVSLVPLALTTLKVLRHLQRSRFEQVGALVLTPMQHEEVERVLLGYIGHVLERRLQSIDFIQRLRRQP